MFYYLDGIVAHLAPYLAVIDCGGVGYACHTTSYSQARLTQGKRGKLYTYLNVREDALDLFGFASRDELDAFKMLISVSGVGPKAALAILSEFAPDRLMLFIASGDAKMITKAQGVGPKLAQRIVLELKDKAAKGLPSGVIATEGDVFSSRSERNVGSDNLSEAISALVTLGYNRSDALTALGGADPSMSSDDMIRFALRKLSRI